MSTANKKINKITSSKNKKVIGYYLPIIFIIVIIPLIMHGKIIELPLDIANFWKGGTTHVDFFNYYKSMALIIGTVASLMAFGGLYLNNKLTLLKEKRYYIPMAVYVVFVIISAVMATNRQVAVEGFIEMNQGVFVLLSYMVLTFIIMNYIQDQRDVKIIVYSFLALTVAEGLLGLGQYFGHDFIQTSLGKWLILPAQLKGYDINFLFGPYTIYGTLYNTNFVGSFAALVLPISVAFYLYENGKKQSIISGIVALLAFVVWVGCNSRAGYLGILVALMLGIIVFRNVIKEKSKKVIMLFVGFVLIAVIFNNVSHGTVSGQFSRLMPSTETKKMESIQTQLPVKFESVLIDENTFIVKTTHETLAIVVDGKSLSFIDGEGNPLGSKIDEEGNVAFVDKKYTSYKFQISSSEIKADIYGRNLDLQITDEGQIKVVSINNKLTVPVEAPHIKLFDGKETFASNRGYIWSRTIPMMKDTILIGYGPDHFPMFFPQEDYVGRFNTGSGMLDTVVDKPHNMYMQTAINTGVISLLALIIIWAVYLIDSLKTYLWGNINSFVEYIGAATFLSITAYLVAGIFNDNVISVAPLFWILLGLGIGINNMIKGMLVENRNSRS